MFSKSMFLMCAALGAWGCTYDPAFELSCSPEGTTDGDRECRGGVWVSTGAGPTDAGSSGEDVGAGADVGSTDDGSVDMCIPETDIAMCARLGLTCDPYDGVDNCGAPRSVDCGRCTQAGASCGGGGTPNVCACSDQSDDDFCQKAGATCDPYTATDECGLQRTVNCGSCAELASCGGDNTCGCEVMAACDALGAQCGDVDVDGRCADVMKINCGTCGENASCSQDNQCECDGPGFAPAGNSCVDIDECMMNLDDCDPNATCTNDDGGFDCMCNNGYTGNGKSCSPAGTPGIVTQVETVEIQIADGQTSASATLANPVDSNQSVPFATQRLFDTTADADRITTDVWLADDNTVTVLRDDANGAVIVRVYVVEFDPARALVQSGTFSMNNTVGMADIPTDVDQTRAFSVFYFTNNNGTEGKDDVMIAGDIGPGGMNMRFERESNTGNVDGHWWVVESVGNEFSVQHTRGSMTNASLDLSISSVTTAKSLLLYSYASDRTDNDADKGHATCRLETSTNVACERGSAQNTLPTVSAQVISFTGQEIVYRQTGSFSSGDEVENVALPMAVDATAIPFGGQLGLAGAMATSDDSGTRTPAFFATHELTSAGQDLELRRGSPRDADADFAWQVINF